MAPEPQDRQESVWAFMARILDQLNLSSWFPAAVLVGGLVLLLQLQHHPNEKLPDALRSISNYQPRAYLAIMGGVILATVVVQAFSFETIRVLEGYWGVAGIVDAIRRALAAFFRWRLRRLVRLRARLTNDCLRIVSLDLQEQEDTTAAVGAFLRSAAHDPGDNSTPPKRPKLNEYERVQVEKLKDWRRQAPAPLVERRELILKKIEQYPENRRMLPTRLGNTLRSYEDKASKLVGVPIEDFMNRSYDSLQPSLRHRHNQFRTRLDLYASMVSVGLALALAYGFALKGSGHGLGPFVWAAIFVLFSYVCYRAAVTTARAYGEILVTIAQAEGRSPSGASR